MRPSNFSEALAGLGMTQALLARLLDLDKNTPNRWARGASRVPRSVELLLDIWYEYPHLIPEEGK